MQLWPPSQNFLIRTLKNFARIPVRMKKLCAFQKSYSLKCSSEQLQWNPCEPAVTLSARRQKTLANFKRDEDTIFWTKSFFFIKNVSVAKENAFLRTLAKKVLQKPTDSQLRFQKPRKNYESFERKITFVKIFLCTYKIQLWPPCRNFLIKTLRNFCWNSGNDQKLMKFPRNLFVKLFIWTCAMKFWQACRNIVGKNTKNTPKFHERWRYVFLNKIVFLIKNDSLKMENAILTTLAITFL